MCTIRNLSRLNIRDFSSFLEKTCKFKLWNMMLAIFASFLFLPFANIPNIYGILKYPDIHMVYDMTLSIRLESIFYRQVCLSFCHIFSILAFWEPHKTSIEEVTEAHRLEFSEKSTELYTYPHAIPNIMRLKWHGWASSIISDKSLHIILTDCWIRQYLQP